MWTALFFLSRSVSAAETPPPRPDCADVLLAEAVTAFPDHACHLRIRDPGTFAVFCDQRVAEVLTDTEVPIFEPPVKTPSTRPETPWM